jgi:hypothetical protein
MTGHAGMITFVRRSDRSTWHLLMHKKFACSPTFTATDLEQTDHAVYVTEALEFKPPAGTICKGCLTSLHGLAVRTLLTREARRNVRPTDNRGF